MEAKLADDWIKYSNIGGRRVHLRGWDVCLNQANRGCIFERSSQ